SWSKGTLIADAATDSFTRSDIGLPGLVGLGGFQFDGFKVGQKITVEGFSDPANNGTFLVTAVTPTKLTVAGSLADETASGDETIVVHVPKTGVTTLGVNTADSTFTRTTGSFLADGFVEGQRFTTFGFNVNTGDYIVKSATATKLEVYGKLKAGDASGSG